MNIRARTLYRGLGSVIGRCKSKVVAENMVGEIGGRLHAFDKC